MRRADPGATSTTAVGDTLGDAGVRSTQKRPADDGRRSAHRGRSATNSCAPRCSRARTQRLRDFAPDAVLRRLRGYLDSL